MKLRIRLWSVLFCLSFSATAAAQQAAPQTGEQAPGTGAEAAAPEAPAAEQPAAQQAAPAAEGDVARSAFATAIQDREPVDQIQSATTQTDTIYFFTELKDLEGQTVVHRWEHEGEVMAEVSFDVGGPRWRVWSSKELMPDWTGDWTVKVVDAAGNVLDSEQLQYEAAPEVADAGTAEQAAPEAGMADTGAADADPASMDQPAAVE